MMKVSEAILILKGLPHDREVYLDIGILPSKSKPNSGCPSYFNTYGNPVWVDRNWPQPSPNYTVTCKAVH